ncbi:putative transcriptional regulatory protein [Colletotrichum sidae]|uniref:Putative transcriptional regulatory protein n=1 Tax=Colletotrichum sidae TaxID=1347389 RepID=A0A4R8T311_9PEZI|nr:putative transcriptional regulatory protein [Colletotrichum sidae]
MSSPSLVLQNITRGQFSAESPMQFVGDFNFDTTASEFEAMFQSPRPPATPSAPSLKTVTGSVADADYANGANPQFMGLTSDMDPLLLSHYRFDERGMFGFKELAIHSLQDAPVPHHFLVSKQSLFRRRREEAGLDIHRTEAQQQLEEVISPDMGARLIKLFFQVVQPRWPIMSETQILDTPSAAAYLLAAVYAISLPFAVHDDRLSVDVAYDKPPYPALSRIISSCLEHETHSPSISVAQTLLLLVLRPSSDPMVADASYRWDLMGKLVSCATTLGLHLDAASWAIPSWQRSQRRRMSFLIFAVDKWLACSLGRPPFIHSDNWSVTSLDRGNFADAGLQPRDQDQLIDYSRTTEVLNAVLSKLYSLRAISKLSTHPSETLAITQPILGDIDNNVDDSESISAFLHLSRFYVQLMVLRAELRPWLTHKPMSDHRTEALTSIGPQSTREKVKICTSALSEAIRNLSPDADVAFWPAWSQFMFSSICFTLMTMAVTSPTPEEASAWISDLQATRRVLRLKAASFPFLRLGLLRIDALFWRGITNVLHLKPHVAEAFRAAESS